MKTIREIFFIIIITISMLSCSVLWDYTVLPFSKVGKQFDVKWDKFYPNCEYNMFLVDTIHNDSILRGENFCINVWKIKHGNAQSPIQTIMFDNHGKCVGAYEFCYGNANYLDVYKDVPIFKRNMYNDIILDKLEFVNYINIIDTDDVTKQKILEDVDKYDYNIVVFWTDSLGYYMRRHLRQVKKYINKNNETNSFRILYMMIKNNKKSQ